MAEQQVAAPEELRIDGSEAAGSAIRQGGFDAAGGAGARYKLMSPSKLPISRSACLTIPPGLSPTSFLESPVLLSNIKAEPSPTTGSLFKPQPVHASVGSSSFSASQMFPHTFEEKSTDFEFRPSGSITAPAESNQQREIQFQGQCHGFSFTPALVSGVSVSASESDGPATLQAPDSDEVNHTSQNDHRGATPVLADDGYNWRKYGQKQVKGSEFPRSYYKCTHPNCEVKKLFERSHDGQITEIIYKGTHDHPKPQPNRRNSPGTVMPSQEERSGLVPFTGQDDSGSNIYNYMSHRMEQNGNPEVTANDDSEEVAASNRNNDDMDDDDPYSKRRKMDCGMEVTPLVKPIREPRVVVQTLSEVDILDDGYRWRKYGQKVVRGNPNPRSYYKCTAVGCPVRKHVERASHDPKAVITTYEGKHNHDVPTAKSNSHSMSGNGAPRLRPDDNDQISLDLGVGRNSSNENASNEQQQHSQFLHTQVGGSNFRFVQATPIAQYYNVLNTGMTPYGSRENPAQAPTDDLSSLNHASYPYPQSIGRIQSGP